MSPLGLEKTFNESRIKFSEKGVCLNGFDTFFSHCFTEFLVFVVFDVVSVVIILLVISY